MTGAPISDPAPPERIRRDWTARARSTGFDALRYTKFVARMKRLLSLGAFGVIGAVLLFFFIQRQPHQFSLSYERMGNVQDDLAMVHPRLTGADLKGNPFVITADAAIQDAHDPKRATLKNIEADLSLNKDNWINARAAAGIVDMNRGLLELHGGLDMFTDTGYQLHTQGASVDLRQNTVVGPHEVTGQGPLGALRADRFHADRDNNEIILEGHVLTTIDGKK